MSDKSKQKTKTKNSVHDDVSKSLCSIIVGIVDEAPEAATRRVKKKTYSGRPLWVVSSGSIVGQDHDRRFFREAKQVAAKLAAASRGTTTNEWAL